MRAWAGWRGWLGVAALVIATLLPSGTVQGQAGAEVPVCCPGTMPLEAQAMGTLAVTVQVAAGGGAPPAPGLTPSSMPLRPAAGVTVQALAADTANSVAGEAVADAQGQATLAVPAGTYWVVVPVNGQAAGQATAGALALETPGGVRVHAYYEATVGADETVPVALTIRVMLP